MKLGFGLVIVGLVVLVPLIATWAYVGSFAGMNDFCVDQDYNGFIKAGSDLGCASVSGDKIFWRPIERQGENIVFIAEERTIPLKLWQGDDYLIDVEGLGE